MKSPSTREFYIQEIGTAVPAPALGAPESVDLFRQACSDPRMARMLPRIVRLTGIENRHLAVLEERFAPTGSEALYRHFAEQPHGPGMGARTALFERVSGPLVLRALCDFTPQRLAAVDMLITVSCTHASAPGLERTLLQQTALRPSVQRWNLGFMGCSAGLAALRLVRATDGARLPALIVACELSSLHFQYTSELDQLTANVLFADGAAALLVGTQHASARVVACDCLALPQHAEQMVWFADDHGLRLRLSPELPDTLAATVPAAVAEFLAAQGTSVAAIDHWLVHPGGPQILDAVEQALGLRADALRLSRDVLRRYGNMSSPTIFFILKELLALRVDGHCVALAFGPGLTVELALLEIRHGDL